MFSFWKERNFKTLSWIYKIKQKRNTGIYDKLKVNNTVEEITTVKKRWKDQVDGMGKDR
jgi:DNA replication protein DnaD